MATRFLFVSVSTNGRKSRSGYRRQRKRSFHLKTRAKPTMLKTAIRFFCHWNTKNRISVLNALVLKRFSSKQERVKGLFRVVVLYITERRDGNSFGGARNSPKQLTKRIYCVTKRFCNKTLPTNFYSRFQHLEIKTFFSYITNMLPKHWVAETWLMGIEQNFFPLFIWSYS